MNFKQIKKKDGDYMDNKLDVITNLFEDTSIRSVWDSTKEDYYFSVIDVIMALTDNDYQKSRNYWKWLKGKLNSEGSELVSYTNQLKMKSPKDGKYYNTDVLDTKGIFRLVESIPSPKAEPFKVWLANLGSERVDEVFDPEIAICRAILYYKNKGYDDNWIKMRLTGIVDRFKLTDACKASGINKPFEYGILTNEIYKSWSGMSASEYKTFKGIRKESLRDNMTDVEVALTDLGEVATRELVREHKPFGLAENKKIARRGGNIASVAKENLERELGRSVLSSNNALNYRYLDENLLEVSDTNE